MSMLKGGENRKRRARKKVHGFLERSRRQKTSGSGSHVLNKRRAKGRKKISA